MSRLAYRHAGASPRMRLATARLSLPGGNEFFSRPLAILISNCLLLLCGETIEMQSRSDQEVVLLKCRAECSAAHQGEAVLPGTATAPSRRPTVTARGPSAAASKCSSRPTICSLAAQKVAVPPPRLARGVGSAPRAGCRPPSLIFAFERLRRDSTSTLVAASPGSPTRAFRASSSRPRRLQEVEGCPRGQQSLQNPRNEGQSNKQRQSS
jgi:hypothetical protein